MKRKLELLTNSDPIIFKRIRANCRKLNSTVNELSDSFVASLLERVSNCSHLMSILSISRNMQEYTWDMIHSTHWKLVAPQCRDCYAFGSYVSLMVKYFLQIERSFDFLSSCIKMADKALVLGGQLFQRPLQRMIGMLCKEALLCDEMQNILDQRIPSSKHLSSQLPKHVNHILSQRIRREAKVDVLQFYQRFLATSTPVVLTDCMNEWPALSDPAHSWKNLRYIREGRCK